MRLPVASFSGPFRDASGLETVGGGPGPGCADWRRLGVRCVLVSMAVLAVMLIYTRVRAGTFGSDFHGGMWKAGHDVLAGRSPYAAANSKVLFELRSAFIPPPPLAILAVPFALLPFSVAVTLWSALCVVGFIGALWLVGVRDRRFLLAAVCSYPFVASLLFGQPDGLFALALAATWRYRDSRRGAVVAGVLIAAKLLAWPLVLWFIVTRRTRSAVVAVCSGVGVLLLSWALIGFAGLSRYPQLLSADAHAFAATSYSLAAEVMLFGGSLSLAQIVSVVIGMTAALAAGRLGRGTELSWFAAAVAIGLLVSPLMEMCYLTALFVVLAIARPRLDALVISTAVLWLAPPGWLPASDAWLQIAIVLALMTSITLLVGRRTTPSGPSAAAAPRTALASPWPPGEAVVPALHLN
jgi:Glycosyltransferase family 87